LAEQLQGVRHVNLGPKPTFMSTICDVLNASEGTLAGLTIPNVSFLAARDKDAQFTTPPPPSHYGKVEHIDIHCSFQPNTQKQLYALTELVSGALSLQTLTVVITEYPTDAFLYRNKEFIDLEDSLINSRASVPQLFALPSLLDMPTPAQKRELALNADGAAWGTAFVEALTGARRLTAPLPPANPVDDAITRLLDSLDLDPRPPQQIGGERPRDDDEKANTLAVTTTGRQQAAVASTADEVRRNALQVMAKLDEKPKHEYMSADQWKTGVMIFLSTPLPPTITHLTLRMLFPPAQPIRALSCLSLLETLSLQHCDITDATLEELMLDFVHMRHLRSIDLTRNRLSDGALFRPMAEQMPSLETLLLPYNNTGGRAFTGLFEGLAESGNEVLKTIDFSYNPFQAEGLSFFGITGWKARDATLRLPNIFDRETVAGIESLMPDGSTLCLEGVNRDDGYGWSRAAVAARLEM
jgi:hypothetical protein